MPPDQVRETHCFDCLHLSQIRTPQPDADPRVSVRDDSCSRPVELPCPRRQGTRTRSGPDTEGSKVSIPTIRVAFRNYTNVCDFVEPLTRPRSSDTLSREGKGMCRMPKSWVICVRFTLIKNPSDQVGPTPIARRVLTLATCDPDYSNA